MAVLEYGILDNATPVNWQCPLNAGLVSWWLIRRNIRTWHNGSPSASTFDGPNEWRDLCNRNRATLMTNSPVPTLGASVGRPGGQGAANWDAGSNQRGFKVRSNVGMNTTAFTIAAWVRTVNAGRRQSYYGDSVAWFETTVTNTWRYQLASGPTASSSFQLTANRWHHLVATYDGTTMRFYADGVLKASISITTSIPNSISLTNDLMIGNRNDQTRWEGQIDDVRVWSRMLGGGEVEALYQDSKRGYPLTLNYLYQRFYATNPDATAEYDGAEITVTAGEFLAEDDPNSTASYAAPTITVTPAVIAASVANTANYAGSTITVTAATFAASEAAVAAFDGATITVTAAAFLGGAITTASFAGPTITVTAASFKARPDYIGAGRSTWLGRFRRGTEVPLAYAFSEVPDAAPTVRIYSGVDLHEEFRLPLDDRTRATFATHHFLGQDYEDGRYTMAISWTVDSNPQYTVDYFDVLGGLGLPPVIAVAEQKRPLGRSAIRIDADGQARISYQARIPNP